MRSLSGQTYRQQHLLFFDQIRGEVDFYAFESGQSSIETPWWRVQGNYGDRQICRRNNFQSQLFAVLFKKCADLVRVRDRWLFG